jgi:hypothetical protein
LARNSAAEVVTDPCRLQTWLDRLQPTEAAPDIAAFVSHWIAELFNALDYAYLGW